MNKLEVFQMSAVLRQLTEEQLLELNREVINELKWKRHRTIREMKPSLKMNTKVEWKNENVMVRGEIITVKRVNALVCVRNDNGTSSQWEVPIAMLELVK
jgi:hypothetical protein